MIVSLSPLLAKVSPQIKPEDIMLVRGSWVRFSGEYPDTHKWAKGKVFTVEKNQLVQMTYSYILPGADYKDIDLSNATGGLKLYPENEGVLYEIGLGFKPGNYIVHFYIPKDQYVHALGEATMIPSIMDPNLKYLGAKEWRDSPYDAPLIKLYAIKDQAAFIMRLSVLESTFYDKVSIKFYVNKCVLKEIEKPTAEQIEAALYIPFYTELRGW